MDVMPQPAVPQELRDILPASLLDIPRAAVRPQRVARASGTDQQVDTYGWDTVFAIAIPDVNRAIAGRKSSPPGFDYRDDAGHVTCQGRFGDWWVCPGGDGSNLYVALPVTAVRGSYPGAGGQNVAFTYDRLTAVVEIKLRFVPHGDAAADPNSGTFHDLVVRSASEDPADPVAALVRVEWENGDVQPPLATYVIEGAITGWCNAHLDAFAHVFATVNLNRYIDRDQWAFCNPSYTSYAYIDGATVDQSLLGVLCMTGGRTTSTNLQQISPFTIPGSSRAGFLVSQKRFLEDLVLPAIPLNWTQARVADFEIASDDQSLSLREGASVRLPDVQHGGGTYTPYLKRFTLKLENQVIQIDAYSEVEISPGITGWCQSTHWYTVGLGRSDGGQTLVYRQYNDPVTANGHAEAPGIKVLEWMLAALAAIVVVILGVLTDGAAFILSALLAGLLFGVAGATPKIIEAVNSDAAPSIDLLVFNGTDAIRWAGGDTFNLDYANLNRSLQLGGTPRFA